MPFDVPLSRKLKAEGWKVKIREKEARSSRRMSRSCTRRTNGGSASVTGSCSCRRAGGSKISTLR